MIKYKFDITPEMEKDFGKLDLKYSITDTMSKKLVEEIDKDLIDDIMDKFSRNEIKAVIASGGELKPWMVDYLAEKI